MRIPIDFVLECIARRFVKTEAAGARIPLYTYDARRTIIVRRFVKAVELRAFSARVHFVQETPLLYEPTNNFGTRWSLNYCSPVRKIHRTSRVQRVR